MKVLVTGARGQLGHELVKHAPSDFDVRGYAREELDIVDYARVLERVYLERPDWIVNAAAYSLVDKAEAEPEEARLINVEGAANLAKAAKLYGARLVHVSTDFIFDGRQGHPYQPNDPANPLSVYGRTKLDGEREVQRILGDDTLLIRTAWVYSTHGRNFVKTMIKLMHERDVLRVVVDQVGTPTCAAELARVLYRTMRADLRGIYHWTDAGVASWYDFAQAILELGLANGLFDRPVRIEPIPSEAYPLPARRPHYSVLDKDSLRAAIDYPGLYWRDALRNMLQEYL
ncbi:MAG: dTDP-4-dehydrorhamnose reductase [Thiotrichales bacterium]